MAQESRNQSRYDKNIQSLLEAVSMLEREVAVLMDRFGVDGGTLRRALDVVGLVSADVARQAAQAFGLADARAMESLGRDVRSLLEQVARLRRRDADGAARIERLEESIARLEGAAAAMARLQGKAQGVMSRLEERSEAFEQALERRMQQLEAVDSLKSRIERLEEMVLEAAASPEPKLLARPRATRAIRSLDSASRTEHDAGGDVSAAAAKPTAR
ncbi:MAG TPA: hypothetical protein VEC57_04205 [Candidatus Limnocylindrales bacterium]|nr:hypothetical protein [Candidatus Limnocylindrales bacterium]